MATPSPIVSMAPTRVTNTNAGSNAQNTGPKLRSKPGHAVLGMPIHAACPMEATSYRPNKPATTEPAMTPITGAHRRSGPVAFSASPLMSSTVARALTGADNGAAPARTWVSMSNTIGITVTAISMITVPATVGVSTLRSRDSRAARANWNNEEITTRVASIAGPPLARAATHTAMNAPEVPISST